MRPRLACTAILLLNLGALCACTPPLLAADAAPDTAAGAARPPKPIPDVEPEVTQQLRRVLRQIADASITPEPFTDKARQALFPERAAQLTQQMRGYGALGELQLLQRSVDGETRLYRYRARYARQNAIVDLTFGKSGRIDFLAFRPE